MSIIRNISQSLRGKIVESRPITIKKLFEYRGIKCMLHGHAGQWSVSEETTGLFMRGWSTMQGAIDQTKQVIDDVTPEKVQELINAKIKIN